MKKDIYIISIFIFIIDQISKYLIINFFDIGDSIKVIPDVLYITFITNTGAAWGILQGQVSLLIVISFFVIYLITQLIKEFNEFTLMKKIAYGILLGGIFGNLVDRIAYGYVIDFIDMYIFGYDFPVFNISDSAIVIGAILIIYDTFIKGDKKNEIINS